jgi:hypothetical protein
MKKKKIKYYNYNPYTKDCFSTVKKHIPKWYKDIENVIIEKNPFSPVVKSAKACMPFLDCLTTGYVYETTQDIRITQVDGGTAFQWNISSPDMVTIDERDISNPVPTPPGFLNNHYVWKIPFSMQTPAGYSCLITHPLNRTDLPFMSVSGIIDSDYGVASGGYPFFLKEGFSGIIPTGTPILQIIPFKRDNWISEYSEDLKDIEYKNSYYSNRVIMGWYKNKVWKKKSFE